MFSFAGKCHYLNAQGSPLQAGPCRISFDDEALTLTPVSGSPVVFDLGDIEAFLPGDYELSLTLYTGDKLALNQFGKAFQDLTHHLRQAYFQRLVRCLLLEDLQEIARFDGFSQLKSPERDFAAPAEFRLYKSNLAVLPATATGFQWRLADIDSVRFDAATWATTLESERATLTITKLGKRTEEFTDRLQEASSAIKERSALAVRLLFPFLAPEQIQQVVMALREGRAAPLSKLRTIDPRIEPALLANAVDATLKPYFDALTKHVAPSLLSAGFKISRPDEAGEKETGEAGSEGTGVEAAPGAEETAASDRLDLPIVYWFFFPLVAKSGSSAPRNVVAWEFTSASGRATYFFRLVPPEQARLLQDPSKSSALVADALQKLNQAIVLLNFRREPIYLSDESLELQPRFRRYTIACRKIPELRRLRSSFLGRAVHTSPDAWQSQFDGFLANT
jgi:hypothetical protein